MIENTIRQVIRHLIKEELQVQELFLDGQPFYGTAEELDAIEDFESKEFRLNGKLHRDGGPAFIPARGQIRYYRHGKFHNDNGPAVIQPDGYKAWYQDGKLIKVESPHDWIFGDSQS